MFFLRIATLLAFAQQSARPAQEPAARIEGIVVKAGSGEPLFKAIP